ncbi:pirin family protein [Kordiimonas aquimaris]|uniref:pirin family protein n=1 Tax=Kordiimonas aquimaris TaxID=707591 RepID=UPI0021D2DB15|nr:pirin family protein [Kordiimonas aquimaris]
MKHRSIQTLFPAQAVPEGKGVTVHRSIGRKGMSKLDPFLLLDEMDIKADAKGVGFPEHPHRGFETVTYMLSGSMQHRDTAGNKGEIGPGEAQWMTAGRGIVHSEMPTSTGTDIAGFQLWVNLPAKDKMKAPRYQDVAYDTIPTLRGDGFTARVVAGTLLGTEGPVKEIAVKPLFADVTLTDNGTISLPLPTDHTAFVYGVTSLFDIEGKTVAPRTLAVLTSGDILQVSGDAGTRFILVAGAPLHEPVARYGPFVMNTREEIMQTLDDWNNGSFIEAR